MRSKIKAVIETPLFKNIIIAVIIFNSLVLGLETFDGAMAHIGPIVMMLDKVCLAIFLVEIIARIYVDGWRFFKNGWNLFDFAIVSFALFPTGQGFTVLRALRVLRVLRIISTVKTMRRVVDGLLNALPGMGSVFLLMALIFYVASVMATKLFASAFPQWFGTLGGSAYSLFQIMTLESWSMGIVRPVMEVYPLAWLFFVPFILITTFAVVNLVVGLVVNSMQDAHSEEQNAATDVYREDVLERLIRIEEHISKQSPKDR